MTTMPAPGFDVATFGEAMLLVADRTRPIKQAECFYKRTAGAETNVAIGLARLGLKVGWASRLGADSMGRYLLAQRQREGIDCSRVEFDPRSPPDSSSRAASSTAATRQWNTTARGRRRAGMGPQVIDEAWLRSARHLHATGVFLAISESSRAAACRTLEVMRAAGRTISFDTNLRPSLWATPESMRHWINHLAVQADWVLPGLEEARFLTGEQTPEAIAAWHRTRGAKLVVVKLGPEGAYYDGEGGSGHVPAFPVKEVVDAVGAGDGFAVGVISALLEGRSAYDAVCGPAPGAARAVQVLGDTEGLPTRAELQAAGL